MRKLMVLLLTLAMFVFLALAASAGGNGSSFSASLKGRSEVAPVDTNAQGTAHFKVDKSGDLSFKLIVANIENVIFAHIHCAPAGSNGPPGITLFAGGPTSANGILAQGQLTAGDFGPGDCSWANIAALITDLQSGDTYVNVHTSANPGGEIRGQIK